MGVLYPDTPWFGMLFWGTSGSGSELEDGTDGFRYV